ncbi:MAG: M48 family metallopeptidase [Chlorobium sp.]|nr:MAG: M48 family metallopeptidase [Chlorobium sp.]
MTPHDGLIVVLPEGFPKKEIPVLLLRHAEWIRKTKETLDAHRLEPFPAAGNGWPCKVLFPHFDEEWELEYQQTSAVAEGDIEELSPTSLLLYGDVANEGVCRKLLFSWLKHRAGLLLLPAFEKLATSLDFDYAEAKVRLQHSRWGSCTAAHVITLNTKLLFLPDYLIRHIMVHELCHTVHLNHSRSFWALVHQHDPLWRIHNREMKSAWKYVPAWVSGKP